MRRTLFGFLVALLAVSPAAAQMTPTIDGVIEDGEWDPFFVETIATDWPTVPRDGNIHAAVDVYLAKDADFWYVAVEAVPGLDGWETACDPTTGSAEALVEMVACENPEAPPEAEECDDIHTWCASSQTILRMTMSVPNPFLFYNTGDCDTNFGFSDPEDLDDAGIEWGYFGLSNGGCEEGPEKHHFQVELKVPRDRLAGADRIMLGGFFWTGDKMYVHLDPRENEWFDCMCIEGAPLEIPVTVDIKPGNTKNCLNLESNGLIKVAILATDDYDPLLNGQGVYCQSITFLNTAAERCRVGDVNSDGRDDLIALYRGRKILANGPVDCESPTTEVTGFTFDGIPIQGEDNICYLGSVCP